MLMSILILELSFTNLEILILQLKIEWPKPHEPCLCHIQMYRSIDNVPNDVSMSDIKSKLTSFRHQNNNV